jgi:hypothetical protein
MSVHNEGFFQDPVGVFILVLCVSDKCQMHYANYANSQNAAIWIDGPSLVDEIRYFGRLRP